MGASRRLDLPLSPITPRQTFRHQNASGNFSSSLLGDTPFHPRVPTERAHLPQSQHQNNPFLHYVECKAPAANVARESGNSTTVHLPWQKLASRPSWQYNQTKSHSAIKGARTNIARGTAYSFCLSKCPEPELRPVAKHPPLSRTHPRRSSRRAQRESPCYKSSSQLGTSRSASVRDDECDDVSALDVYVSPIVHCH